MRSQTAKGRLEQHSRLSPLVTTQTLHTPSQRALEAVGETHHSDLPFFMPCPLAELRLHRQSFLNWPDAGVGLYRVDLGFLGARKGFGGSSA